MHLPHLICKDEHIKIKTLHNRRAFLHTPYCLLKKAYQILLRESLNSFGLTTVNTLEMVKPK